MADSTASKADPDKSGKPASSGSIGRSNGNDVDPKSDQPAKSADGAEGKQRKNSASTQDDQNLLKYANVGTLSDVVAAAASASEAAMEASTSTSKPVLGKRPHDESTEHDELAEEPAEGSSRASKSASPSSTGDGSGQLATNGKGGSQPEKKSKTSNASNGNSNKDGSKARRPFQRPKLKGTACSACRKSKLKCDEGQPCAPCGRRKVECIRDPQIRLFRSSLDYLSNAATGGLPPQGLEAAITSAASESHAVAAHAAQLASLRHATYDEKLARPSPGTGGSSGGRIYPASATTPRGPPSPRGHPYHLQGPMSATSAAAAAAANLAAVMPGDVKPARPQTAGAAPREGSSRSPGQVGGLHQHHHHHHQPLGPPFLPSMFHPGFPPHGFHHHSHQQPLPPYGHNPYYRFQHSPPHSAHSGGIAGPMPDFRLPQQSFASWRPASYSGNPVAKREERLPSLASAVKIKEEPIEARVWPTAQAERERKEIGGLPMAKKTSSSDTGDVASVRSAKIEPPSSTSPPLRSLHEDVRGSPPIHSSSTSSLPPISKLIGGQPRPAASSLNGLLNDDPAADESLESIAEGADFPSYLDPWKSVLIDAGIVSMQNLRQEIEPEMVKQYADYLADTYPDQITNVTQRFKLKFALEKAIHVQVEEAGMLPPPTLPYPGLAHPGLSGML